MCAFLVVGAWGQSIDSLPGIGTVPYIATGPGVRLEIRYYGANLAPVVCVIVNGTQTKEVNSIRSFDGLMDLSTASDAVQFLRLYTAFGRPVTFRETRRMWEICARSNLDLPFVLGQADSLRILENSPEGTWGVVDSAEASAVASNYPRVMRRKGELIVTRLMLDFARGVPRVTELSEAVSNSGGYRFLSQTETSSGPLKRIGWRWPFGPGDDDGLCAGPLPFLATRQGVGLRVRYSRVTHEPYLVLEISGRAPTVVKNSSDMSGLFNVRHGWEALQIARLHATNVGPFYFNDFRGSFEICNRARVDAEYAFGSPTLKLILSRAEDGKFGMVTAPAACAIADRYPTVTLQGGRFLVTRLIVSFATPHTELCKVQESVSRTGAYRLVSTERIRDQALLEVPFHTWSR